MIGSFGFPRFAWRHFTTPVSGAQQGPATPGGTDRTLARIHGTHHVKPSIRSAAGHVLAQARPQHRRFIAFNEDFNDVDSSSSLRMASFGEVTRRAPAGGRSPQVGRAFPGSLP